MSSLNFLKFLSAQEEANILPDNNNIRIRDRTWAVHKVHRKRALYLQAKIAGATPSTCNAPIWENEGVIVGRIRTDSVIESPIGENRCSMFVQ